MTDTKTCTKCETVKSLTDFHRSVRKDRPTGKGFKYFSFCKDCFNQHSRDRYHSGVKYVETRQKYYATDRGRQISEKSSVKHYESIPGRALHLLNGAKKREHKWPVFDIDREFIESKLKIGTCEVTGIAFDMKPMGRASRKNPFAPSLDRIDNTKGYIRSNVRLVLWAVNLMHGEMTDEQLVEMCKAVIRGMEK